MKLDLRVPVNDKDSPDKETIVGQISISKTWSEYSYIISFVFNNCVLIYLISVIFNDLHVITAYLRIDIYV